MDSRSRGSLDGLQCPKRVWVMTVLSDDEAVGPDGAVPPGLAFHLSRCASCRALADELVGVALGLAEWCGSDPPDSLQARADAQAHAALAAGAILTGRADPGTDGIELLGAPSSYRRRRWIVPLTAAAMILLAVGVVGVMRLADERDRGTGSGVVEAPVAPVEITKPQAALVRDGVESKQDPTAVPEAYRSEECKGDDCVERAFAPGRGRRKSSARDLDTSGDKESTTNAPDDR